MAKWVDRYGTDIIKLGVFSVEVYWDSSQGRGYMFRVEGMPSKNFYADNLEAKKAALKAAFDIFNEAAMDALESKL